MMKHFKINLVVIKFNAINNKIRLWWNILKKSDCHEILWKKEKIDYDKILKDICNCHKIHWNE